jgi:hypothetical protein
VVRGHAATRAVVALAAVLVSVASFAPATRAAGPHKAFWGPLGINGKSAFPIYRDLGVSIFETDLSWADVAVRRPQHPLDPNDPAYRWPSDIQSAINQAAAHRMRILLQVIHTPRWANGGRVQTWAPTNPRDLANFLTAAARRYPSVHLWMIWGEPNRVGDFEPLTPAPRARKLTPKEAIAPHRYARMLDASYAALKRASAKNLVIGGNTFTWGDISPRDWIENLRLPNGRPPRMDMYGHNPFVMRAPNLANPQSPGGDFDFSDLARLERLVDRDLAPRGHHLKLFLSEWTIATSPGDIHFGFWVTPSLQAQWITNAARIVRGHSFIYDMAWINLADDPPGVGSREGLLDQNGNPKPGYFAFKAG